MINRLLTMLVVGVVASGCTGEKAEVGASAAAKPPAAPAAEATAAVLQSDGTPVAKLEFVLSARPVVGAPLEMRLDYSATTAIHVLQVRTEATSLAIDPAGAQASVALEAGKTSSHQIRFTPQREGLAEITVRLRALPDGAETVYVIPVLVAAAAGGA